MRRRRIRGGDNAGVSNGHQGSGGVERRCMRMSEVVGFARDSCVVYGSLSLDDFSW